MLGDPVGFIDPFGLYCSNNDKYVLKEMLYGETTWNERQKNGLDLTEESSKFFHDMSESVYSNDNSDNILAYELSVLFDKIGNAFDYIHKHTDKPKE